MTLTAPTTPFTFTTVSAGTTWTQVAPTLWSGIQGTEFRGTVEFADCRFIACDRVGAVIGTFDTLSDAQQQVNRFAGRDDLTHRTRFPLAPATIRGRVVALLATIVTVTAGAAALMIGAIHP